MTSLPAHLSAEPAGRHPLSREILAEHQRERVLDAATGVFATRGYQGTTVDHIIAAAQSGVGSFYELFDNKSDCFLQAYERIVATTRGLIVAAAPASMPWPERACGALRALLEEIEAAPLRAHVALVEVQTAGPAALARYEETVDSAIPFLVMGRKASPVGGGLPPRLEEAIVGGLAWFLQRLVLGEFKGVDAHLPDILEIAVEPYLGQTATAELFARSVPAAL